MTDYLWVTRLKFLIAQQGKTNIELTKSIGMSEPNFYRCLKRGSIEIKHLNKIAEFLNVPVSYFFEEGKGKGNTTNIGKGNIAVTGNENFLGDPATPYGTNSEINELKEKVQYLVALLAEKDKLIAEKERLIQMLLKEEKLR